MHFSKSILHLHCQNTFETNRNKTNSNHPHSCVSIINLLLYSISISRNRSLSLRLQAVRNNLRSIFPILQNSQVLERNAIHMRVQINIRYTQLHLASPQTRLRTHSSRNASQRASVVGVRGSFANSLPLDGTTPPDSHMPSLPSANSTLFPAKASGSMQYFRIPAGTSPIPTDCVRALPPLRLSSHQSMGSCLPILPITPSPRFDRVNKRSSSPNLSAGRRTQDAGAGHDFAEHFLAVVGRFLEGKSRVPFERTHSEPGWRFGCRTDTRRRRVLHSSLQIRARRSGKSMGCLGIWRERGMRVVHSKIQILGWVVLSYQVDHKIRVPNAGMNRFLIQGMKWNGIGFTLPASLDCFKWRALSSQPRYRTKQVTFEKLWIKSNKKQNTIHIQHFHTNYF